ncbi:H-NS family nucleoid-associated regulatory protein [Ralstonia holmesii]|uniref:H-NS family nucleoid-associated regulatory protein n=1 Tax=Ralstonia TaxID=48736 RepID=UPI00046B05E3|nr:H-NS family nucleoid-associated regulatory protein [Ralstonia pickettii]
MALNEITQEFDEIAQKRAALEAELNSLTKHEEEAKAHMHANVVSQVQGLVDYFQIARDELTFTAPLKLVPRFLNPETADTWHGFGKRPDWINDDNIDEYRIKPQKKGKKTSTKSSTKKAQQAKSKTTQPVTEQVEADNAAATGADISTNAPSEATSPTAIIAAPESTAAVSELTQRPVGTTAAQPTVAHGFSLMAGGVQSYLAAVKAS